MFETIKNLIRRVRAAMGGNIMNGISDVVKNGNTVSNIMMENIDLWARMFAGTPPWSSKDGANQCLGLPAMVAAEVARSVTIEMGMTITGSPMADYLAEQMVPVLKEIRSTTEYACAGGGIVFKPYVSGDKIVTEVVQSTAFYPIAFDSSRKITGAYFVYRKWEGSKVYTRLEKHERVDANYIITNTAYVSAIEESIGKECKLTDVDEWAEIEPMVTLEAVNGMLFSYFRMPMGNTVDSRSPLGISVYGRGNAAELIMEADLQFRRLIWEYEGGELAIHASTDAFKNSGGRPDLPKGRERLYIKTDIDALAGANGADLLKEWAPTLRDESYNRGLNKILMKVEDATCISRGTFSEPEAEARTATELRILKQRTYAQVTDIQKALQDALDDLLYAQYCIAVLYDLAPSGDYEAAYKWDDSILMDADAERMRDKDDVATGLMNKWEYRVKWYGEDEETARRMVGEYDDAEEKAADPFNLDTPGEGAV